MSEGKKITQKRDIAVKTNDGRILKKTVEFYEGEDENSAILFKVEIFEKGEKGWIHKEITNKDELDKYIESEA